MTKVVLIERNVGPSLCENCRAGKPFPPLEGADGGPSTTDTSREHSTSSPTQQRISAELSIVRFAVVEIEVEPTAFLPAKRGIHDQRRHRREVSELQKIDGDVEVPVKLPNLTLKIPETGAGALEALVGADNPDVIPHQAPDLVPVVINHDQLIDVLHISGLPFRQGDFADRMRRWLLAHERFTGAMSDNQSFEERVARETIRAVQTGARDFSDG
jgi:hypothetical protein